MARTLPRPRLYYMLKQQPGLLLMILDGTSKRQPGHIRQYRFMQWRLIVSPAASYQQLSSATSHASASRTTSWRHKRVTWFGGPSRIVSMMATNITKVRYPILDGKGFDCSVPQGVAGIYAPKATRLQRSRQMA